MAKPQQILDPAGRKRRKAVLERIGGFWPAELEDTTIKGRERVLAVLEDHDRAQRNIALMNPEYYSPEFHKEILGAIDRERKAIAAQQKRSINTKAFWQMRLAHD